MKNNELLIDPIFDESYETYAKNKNIKSILKNILWLFVYVFATVGFAVVIGLTYAIKIYG